jgi:hypothetical protein
MARSVLGEIDFDPASSEVFNQLVGARSYCTATDDGLCCDWPSDVTIWLNPPGGKRANRSLAALFWDKLINTKVKHAIFMGFSLEQMQTTQRSRLSILDFPVCVPRKRIAFIKPDGTPGPAPSHSNVIVYVPGTVDVRDRFRNVFRSLGACT